MTRFFSVLCIYIYNCNFLRVWLNICNDPDSLIVSPRARAEAELSEYLYKKCFPSVSTSWRQTSWWIQQTLKIRGTVELLGDKTEILINFMFFSIISTLVLIIQQVVQWTGLYFQTFQSTTSSVRTWLKRKMLSWWMSMFWPK